MTPCYDDAILVLADLLMPTPWQNGGQAHILVVLRDLLKLTQSMYMVSMPVVLRTDMPVVLGALMSTTARHPPPGYRNTNLLCLSSLLALTTEGGHMLCRLSVSIRHPPPPKGVDQPETGISIVGVHMAS